MTVRFVSPAGPFHADVTVPGDKSLSHRALIFAAMAAGTSRVTGLAPGEDVASTARALRGLGVGIDTDGVVTSPGVERWTAPDGPIDAGNSGTTLRLLAGALAARPFRSTLIGDPSLMRRPMRRLIDPLAALGAVVEVSSTGTAPVTVAGSGLHGGEVSVPVASAQVRTAVALAALQAEGSTLIDSPPGFRDHTERTLAAMGRGRWESATAFRIAPGPVPPGNVAVPGDPSSAAFLFAAAALRPGASVTVRNLGLNPGRIGYLDALAEMGARVTIEPDRDREAAEPVGTATVTGSHLNGITIRGELTVRCLDELPLLALVAATASGPTRITDAAELRAKESDRIASTAALLRALGAAVETDPEGMLISGGARLQAARVVAAGDHRLAMTAAVGATAAGSVEIDGFDVAAVSWPGFADALEQVWLSSR